VLASGAAATAQSAGPGSAPGAGTHPAPRQILAHPQASPGTRGAISTATSSMVSPGLGSRATLSVGMRIVKPRE